MAWSDAARAAALAMRRFKRKRPDLSSLKPGTRRILADARIRQNKYWVGPKARFSRAGMVKDLRRMRKWKRSQDIDTAFQKHLARTRGFD